jgi:hypothetical protein
LPLPRRFLQNQGTTPQQGTKQSRKSSMLEVARFLVSHHFFEYLGVAGESGCASSSCDLKAHERMIPAHRVCLPLTTSFGSRRFSDGAKCLETEGSLGGGLRRWAKILPGYYG